ncbi:MAG: CrcB family protein, partial [Verrucomicrobia bacterium]|nr:CrcB family protein [Verrucomicrobiota bacterium]
MPVSVVIILSISASASLGALLRFWLGISLNPIFPTIPLGTLAANVIGGFLMGVFITITKNHVYIPEVIRFAIATGFLGGLTTFSTFSA